METYILTDRGFCCLHDGRPVWLSCDEFKNVVSTNHREIAVLLGGVEYRQAKASVSNASFNDVLPGGFIIRQERLKGGQVMIMGAREDILRILYDAVPKGAVKVCIPYGIAVRAYLLSRCLSLENAAHIVVNDAGERVLITVIDGLSIVETRELVFQDGERLVDEVRRSEKRLLERSGTRGAVTIVSDHRAYLDAAAKQRRPEELIEIDGVLPVFSVLDQARFGVHFPSPSSEAAQKRQERWRQGILKYSLPSLLLTGAMVLAVMASMVAAEAAQKVSDLKAEVLLRESDLKTKTIHTYQDRLRSVKTISWERSFIDLMNSLRSGWRLQKVVWESGFESGEKISAFVLQGEAGSFDACGIYQKAATTNELVSGRPAVRVIYRKPSDPEDGGKGI